MGEVVFLFTTFLVTDREPCRLPRFEACSRLPGEMLTSDNFDNVITFEVTLSYLVIEVIASVSFSAVDKIHAFLFQLHQPPAF